MVSLLCTEISEDLLPSWRARQVCKTKNLRSQSRPSDHDSKPINFTVNHIIFRYFGYHFLTFCPASALKTECVLHWTAEWKTTGHKLWVQWEMSCVNAIFECKFDSFPKSVLFSVKLAEMSYLVSIITLQDEKNDNIECSHVFSNYLILLYFSQSSQYIEDITRWRDMNFMFEWQE